MAAKTIVFIIVLLAAFGVFGFSLRRMIALISIGKPENRLDHLWERFKKMMIVAIGQTKLFREPVAGLMHAFIFWGFLVLLSSVLEAIGEGFIPGILFSVYRCLLSTISIFSRPIYWIGYYRNLYSLVSPVYS